MNCTNTHTEGGVRERNLCGKKYVIKFIKNDKKGNLRREILHIYEYY